LRRNWLLPLTGVAFVVFLILSSVVGGEPPSADEDVTKIVEHYKDNKDSIMIASLLGSIAAVFLVFFANHLRHLMRASRTAPTILAGAAIVAVGAGIDITIQFALAEAAEDIEPTAVQALQALWDNDFMPMAIGIVVFLISAGTSTLATGALPKWLGWVAIALGVIGVTPLGFAAAIGAGLWILVASVLLAVRGRRPADVAAGGPPSG
jgi:succinate dehydrogenase/fumarate reductase cytochrome b subunit